MRIQRSISTARLAGGSFLFLTGFLWLSVALDKSLDPSFGVDDLLLSGVERMAVAADFNSDRLLRRANQYFVAANTGCYNFKILGVNSFFHDPLTASRGFLKNTKDQ